MSAAAGTVSGSRSATVQMATSAITTTTTAAAPGPSPGSCPDGDGGAAAGGGHFQRGQFTIVGSLNVRTPQQPTNELKIRCCSARRIFVLLGNTTGWQEVVIAGGGGGGGWLFHIHREVLLIFDYALHRAAGWRHDCRMIAISRLEQVIAVIMLLIRRRR